MTYSVVSAGSGYADGVYYSVPLFGGSGSGATATITVVGGVVTAFAIGQPGVGYRIGDILDLTLATNPGLVQGSGFRYQISSIGYTNDTRTWLPYQSMPERAVTGMAVFDALDPNGVYQTYANILGSLAVRTQYDSRFLSRQASPVTAEAPQQLLGTTPAYVDPTKWLGAWDFSASPSPNIVASSPGGSWSAPSGGSISGGSLNTVPNSTSTASCTTTSYTKLSIACFVTFGVGSTTQMHISPTNGGAPRFYINAAAAFDASFSSIPGYTNPSIRDGNKHHYAWTFDLTTGILLVYVDGVLNQTRTGGTSSAINTGTPTITENTGSDNYTVDNVVMSFEIWSSAAVAVLASGVMPTSAGTLGNPGSVYGYDVSTLKKIGEEYGYSVNALDSVSFIRAGLLNTVPSTKHKGTSLGVSDRLKTMNYKGYATEVWGVSGAARVILSPSAGASNNALPLLQFPLYSSTPGIRVSNWSNNYPASYSGGVITYNNIAVVEVSGGRDAFNRPNGIPSTNDYFEVFDGATHWRFVYMPYVLSSPVITLGGTYSVASGAYTNVALNTVTGNGSGALATVILSSSSVSSVTITTVGSNYHVNDILSIPAITGVTVTTPATLQLTAASAYDTSKSGLCEYAYTSAYGFLPGYNVNGYPSLTSAPAVGSTIYNDAASVYAYGVTASGYLDVRGMSNPRITDQFGNPLYLPAGAVGYAQGAGCSIGFVVGADGSLVTIKSLYNSRPYSVTTGSVPSFGCGIVGSLYNTTAQYMSGATPVSGTFTNVPLTANFTSVGQGALATVTLVGGYVTSIVVTTLGYGYLPTNILYVTASAFGLGFTGPTGYTGASVTIVHSSVYYLTTTITSPSANPLIAAPATANTASPKAVAVPVWIDTSVNAIYQNAFNLYSTINSWNTANTGGSNYVTSAPILLTTVAQEAGYQPPTSTYGYQTINNRSVLAPPLPALTKSIAPTGLLILNGGGGYTYTDPTTGYSYNTYRQYGPMNGGHGDGLYAYITVTGGVVTSVVPDPLFPGYEYVTGDILVPGAGVSFDMLGTVVTDPTAITVGNGFSCIVRGQRSLETVGTITPGTGYSSAANGQTYELISANGSGALAKFAISGGAVTGITLTSARGQNYQYGDVITAPSLPGGSGFSCPVSTLISGLNEEASAAIAKTPSNGSSSNSWYCKAAAANYVEVPQSYDYNLPGVFLPMSQVVVHVNHADGSYMDFTNPDGTGAYTLVGGPGTNGNAPWNRINRELVTDVLPACISIKYFATDFNLGKNSNALTSASLNSVPEVFTTTETTDFHQATSGTDNVAYSYGQALGLWA
jgi:hypothetical protein